MKVYFPSYYGKFKCTAEKCRHSCCVGWEISVDGETLQKYESLGREDILCHISDGCIALNEGRCPFLQSDGLCRLIAELGDGFTSVICREHPRFYHKIGERIEGGIGASCEEAARIILTSDDYGDFIEVEKASGDIPEETDLDTLAERSEIYELLSDRSVPYRERIAKIRKKYDLPENPHTTEEWREVLSELELLDESHRELISVGNTDSREEYSPYFERFLAYLIFRHASVAQSRDNLRARVGFSLFLSEMLENYTSVFSPTEQKIIDATRIISEEIEYSEDNTASLIFEIESLIY